MKATKTRTKRSAALIMAVLMTLSCYASAMASSTASPMSSRSVTTVHLGSGTVDLGWIYFDTWGYVGYYQNTSSLLEVKMLTQWVFNNGIYDVNFVRFKVHDSDFVKYTEAPSYISAITNGNNRRIEADWESVCTWSYNTNSVFSKEGTYQYVYTSSVAGHDERNLGGWDCFWYPATRSATLLY